MRMRERRGDLSGSATHPSIYRIGGPCQRRPARRDTGRVPRGGVFEKTTPRPKGISTLPPSALTQRSQSSMVVHDFFDDPTLLARSYLTRKRAEAVAEAAPYQVRGPFDYGHWSVTNNCWPVLPGPARPKHIEPKSLETPSSSRVVAPVSAGPRSSLSCPTNAFL